MAMERLSLAMLKDFDLGKVEAAWMAELATVVADLRDRPTDISIRKVVLTLELAPQPEDMTGEAETVHAQFTISNRIPKRSTRKYEMAVKKNGALMVNDISPADCRQGTLDELTTGGSNNDNNG